MATITLDKVKAQGSNFPSNNTVPEFRFENASITSISVAPPPANWKDFPSSSSVTFNGNGRVKLYMQGHYVCTSGTTIGETPCSGQVSLSCAYGDYLVKYTVS